MQIDLLNKSKSLLGVSDLTLVATIKSGLIPALDSRSYDTRVRLLLKTLNTLRISSLEAEPTPLIADAVDRIRALHSFRLAIIGEDAPRRLLLSVAFDGGWEPYMRRIWRDLGPLLDVIFCNCEGYLDSHTHDFPAYASWVRSAQVETQFFYNASSLTVNDLHYLRRKVGTDRWHAKGSQPGDYIQKDGSNPILEQGIPALTALYRLTELYPPLVNDGEFLLRAARHLLGDRAETLAKTDPQTRQNPTEQAALRWFSKSRPRPPFKSAKTDFKKANVQGGIIAQYKDATDACLLLVSFKDAAAASAMLTYLEPKIGRSTAATQEPANEVPFVNLGFTFQGLALAGVPKGTLELLPFEFREGMAARAGILGDRLYNHPTKWSLPERNWPSQDKTDRVELSSVHAIVQYTCKGPSSGSAESTKDKHPLLEAIAQFDNELAKEGVQILSVQPMRRYLEPVSQTVRGHFNFVDGISQPSLETSQHKSDYSDEIVPGDLLLGYENSFGDPPLTGMLWDESTFMVVRKLKQDVAALNAVLSEGEEAERRKAKFMGRSADGEILIADKTITDRKGNDFDYSKDPEGKACPFQSHIRRANPRSTRDDLFSVPRIMRRGMSYGPPFQEDPEAERGLFFMAYNASIAEQFEVIQAWLSGGNSSDRNTYSGLRDPFLGVPQEGEPHDFVYHDESGKEHVVPLSPDKPIVKLEWGLYAFVPSIMAIAGLKDIAAHAGKLEGHKGKNDPKKIDRRALELAGYAQKGAEIIAKLGRVEKLAGFEAAAEQWKIVLEDIVPRLAGASQAVWAAIRQLNGGVLRTPYGVLVCSKTLVTEVFSNRQQRYTVTGYAERMRASFGEIYLGRDDDGPTSRYRVEACPANKAIMAVSRECAFDLAFQQTVKTLTLLVRGSAEARLDVRDIVDGVLAGLSAEWFGVPDGEYVVGGGWHWRADHPTCPGHFHSPSRYMFQPNPGAEAALIGEQHGQATNAAVRRFLNAQGDNGERNLGEIGNALFDAFSGDKELLTSTLIGVMMGFLPTVDGNIRGVLYEWVNNRALWDYQLDYLRDDPEIPKNAEDPHNPEYFFKKACKVLMPPLKRTLLLRPVPELAWRTALVRHPLGAVEVNPGDRIVVSIVSATQECLMNDEDPDDDEGLYFIFGGNRREKNHPTHACPGYEMAIGVMLGMLAGLLGSTRLRPTMTPLQLAVSMRLGR
jgi:Dyp-type peroxidase family